MSTTIVRAAPPDVEPRCPDCPICGRETSYIDDDFQCEHCQCYWPTDFSGPGAWLDEDAAQCTSAWQPWLNNEFAAGKSFQHDVVRCVLDDAHDGEHRNPDWIGTWTDKEPTVFTVPAEETTPASRWTPTEAPTPNPAPAVIDVHLPEADVV